MNQKRDLSANRVIWVPRILMTEIYSSYDATPYWGYPERDASELTFDGKTWTVSNYYKDGCDIPFGQLILVEDGIHWARPQHARLAWDFMKHFRRNESGQIERVELGFELYK